MLLFDFFQDEVGYCELGQVEVAVVLAANHFFNCSYKTLPTPLVLLKTKYHRIALQDFYLIFMTIAICSRFDFHKCKCENTSLIVWTIVIFYQFLQKTLDHWFIT
jgi:hypothetical protein